MSNDRKTAGKGIRAADLNDIPCENMELPDWAKKSKYSSDKRDRGIINLYDKSQKLYNKEISLKLTTPLNSKNIPDEYSKIPKEPNFKNRFTISVKSPSPNIRIRNYSPIINDDKRDELPKLIENGSLAIVDKRENKKYLKLNESDIPQLSDFDDMSYESKSPKSWLESDKYVIINNIDYRVIHFHFLMINGNGRSVK